MGLYLILGYHTNRKNEVPEVLKLEGNRDVALSVARDEGAHFQRWEMHQLDRGRTLVKQWTNHSSRGGASAPSSPASSTGSGTPLPDPSGVEGTGKPEPERTPEPDPEAKPETESKGKKKGSKSTARGAPAPAADENDPENHFG